jgi:putative colanic acid biosynthesis acetyltransferase WcaF
LWWWRISLLRLFGAKIATGVHIHPTAEIEMPWNLEVAKFAAIGSRAIIYNLGQVYLGEGTTISQGVHVCAGTHDYRREDFPLVKAPIYIGNNVWVCADAFVGPNVRIGDRAIVAARAVVIRDVEPDVIVAGNPAVFVKKRGEFIKYAEDVSQKSAAEL